MSEHGPDPLKYHPGNPSERPCATLNEEGGCMDSSVYPGSQGSGKATGHKGHKMHTEHSEHHAGHHPSPKSMGHHSRHGARGKY